MQFQFRFKNGRNILIFDLIYRLQDIFQLPHAIIVVISTKNKTFQKKNNLNMGRCTNSDGLHFSCNNFDITRFQKHAGATFNARTVALNK